MSGVIYATSAPHGTIADPDGGFAMADVPAGSYTLAVWSVDPAARMERSIVVTDGTATEVVATPSG
jgi:hypothetical protein